MRRVLLALLLSLYLVVSVQASPPSFAETNKEGVSVTILDVPKRGAPKLHLQIRTLGLVFEGAFAKDCVYYDNKGKVVEAGRKDKRFAKGKLIRIRTNDKDEIDAVILGTRRKKN
jgi:hypothetical protein